jgi:streptogramin lyase
VGAFPISLLATVVLALLAPAPASAATAVNGVFNLPGVQTNGQLVVGPDNNVWVALEQAVGKVQADGTVTTFASADLGNTIGFLSGGIASADGFIWVSQPVSAGKETIVKIPPANPAGATGVAVTGVNAGATALTAGPDGNVWVAIPGKIVKFSPSNPAGATTYTIAGLSPRAITSASDGTLWVTDTANGGRLLNVTTGGTVTPYLTGGQPQFVGAGPNGQVAFGNPNNSPQQIGLLKPGGTPQTIDRPNGSDPFGVTFGADGAFWVAEFAGNRLARVTTDGQLTTLGGFPAVSGQGPRQIVAGPGNTLWATLDKPGDTGNARIARITGVDPPVADPGPQPGPDPQPQPGPQPTQRDTKPPTVTDVALSKKKFRAGTKTVTLRFTVDEAGTARVTVSRRALGRRRGKACVKPTTRLRKAKPCTRNVRVSAVSVNAVSGKNAVRISTAKRVPGVYNVIVMVTDAAGNASLPIGRTFTITRKPKRR